MKNVLRTMILGLVFTVPVSAEELVATIDLTHAADSVSVRVADGVLHVEAVSGQPQQILIQLPEPGINLPVYALTGMVRYDIEGEGYLQLDNHFGESGTFFTKSLAPQGPLAALSGRSGWRPFVLPFYANSGDQSESGVMTPEALTLSVYLPGSGHAELRDVGLYQYAAGEDPLGGGASWVGGFTTTWIGVIGGCLIGLWGGFVGYLVPRGKARGFVIGSANLLVVAGIVVFFAGLYAIGTGQPYGIYYPLLMLGAILVFVVGWLRLGLPRRYEAVELKKMQAMDA